MTQVRCDGRLSTVTFVPEGSLAPEALEQLTRTRELGALVSVGGALLAVRGDEELLGKLTSGARAAP